MILQIKCKAKHVYLVNKITAYSAAVRWGRGGGVAVGSNLCLTLAAKSNRIILCQDR